MLIYIYFQQRSQLFAIEGGGGTRPPNVPTEEKNHYVTQCASERAPQKYMYFQVSKCICMHIQSMQWYGTINDSMTDETLILRKNYMNMRASGGSELRKNMHLLILKLLFPSIFLLVLQILCLRNIYFQVSNYNCIHYTVEPRYKEVGYNKTLL